MAISKRIDEKCGQKRPQIRAFSLTTHNLKKVAPRFELGIRALQAPALPLGYATNLFKGKPLSGMNVFGSRL